MPYVPLEAGEADAFTPPSLRDLPSLPNPPVFYLRWGTPREKEQVRRLLDSEGVSLYSEETMRSELLKGMKQFFSADDFATWEPRAREWWQAIDAHQKEHEGTPADERPEWVWDGEEVLIEVLEQVGRDWRPFRLMQADSNAYRRMQGHAINAVIIAKVDNLPIAPREGRCYDLDAAMVIADELDKLGREHAPTALIRPSQELGIETITRLYLDKEAEGNSGSPAPSDKTPPASSNGTASAGGKSKASARSKKTPAPSLKTTISP